MNCFLMLILLTGCQKQETSSIKTEVKSMGEDFILGQDDQPNFLSSNIAFSTSEDGYYILDWKLEYFDWKSKSVVPVCNKTDCDHSDAQKCSAYACRGANEILYYEDNIYYARSSYAEEGVMGVTLYRIKKDGTQEEKMYDLYLLSEKKANEIGFTSDMAIHRGYIYYEEVDYDLEKKQRISRLCRRKLEKKAEKEVLQEVQGDDAACSMVRGYGDAVYFVVSHMSEDNETKTEDLCKYDIVSEKSEIVKEFLYENGNNTLFGYTVINGNIYYKEKEKIVWKEKETGKEYTWFDMKEQKQDKIENCWLYGDREYLYLEGIGALEDEREKALFVLDTDGKLVDKIPYGKKNVEQIDYHGADDNGLFFSWQENDKMTIAYYDKEQLGKGTFETKELLIKDYETNEIKECN